MAPYAYTSTYHPRMSYLRLLFHSIVLGFRQVLTSKASIVGLLLPLVLFLLARFAFPANPDDARYGNAFERKFAGNCAMDIRNRYAQDVGADRNKAFRGVTDAACFCTTKAVFTKLSWSELGQVNSLANIDAAVVAKVDAERTACSGALHAFLGKAAN
jgi:hypothetical protein